MDGKFTAAVFCGSTIGKNPEYREKTVLLGKRMAERGMALVYGGGNRGLMGILAHTMHDSGCRVLGVLPEKMNIPSVTDGAVSTETVIVGSMHERKRKMYDSADAIIALPGGIGTFEELFEIYTWRQLGYTGKNIALYNINGYYEHLLMQLDRAVEEGFVHKAVRDLLIVSDNPDIILDRLQNERREIPDKL